MLPSGVAAGHPATVEAGIEILEDGGSAADAAVAASLASCVAETVMTGLLGGGHAIHWDGSEAWLLDCFVDVPSRAGCAARRRCRCRSARSSSTTRSGRAPARCRGFLAGLDALWRRYGRLPWPRVVEPALRLAHSGVRMPPAQASCLAMLASVFTMSADGKRIYAPAGHPLATGDVLSQPGLATALELVAAEGAGSIYRGSLAEALLGIEGIGVARDDLERYEARWLTPAELPYAGTRFLTRTGLSGVPESLARLPPLRDLDEKERVPRAARRSRGPDRRRAHDEPRHGGLRRKRLRPHLEPRARHRRLPCRVSTCT